MSTSSTRLKMGFRHLSWLAYGLASALFAQVGSCYYLDPIDKLEDGSTIVARDTVDHSNLALLSQENFLWGGKSTTDHPARGKRLIGTLHRP